MKFRNHVRTLAAVVVSLALAYAARAEEKSGAAKEAPKGQAAAPSKEAAMPPQMVEYMEKYAAPGPEHDRLKKLLGKWTTITRMWMDPSAPPTESKGSAEFTSMMGGRYVMQSFKGDFMGKPFEGMGIDGYDRFRKQYLSVWIDTASTTIMQSHGSCEPDGKTCTYFGSMDEPMTGEVGKTTKEVVRFIDPDKFSFEMYDNAMGKEMRVMEITYVRVK